MSLPDNVRADAPSRDGSRARTHFPETSTRTVDPKATLLRAPSARDRAGRVPGHTLINAPIVTGDAFYALGPAVFPQRALYGSIISQHATGFPEDPRLPEVFINSNSPFSAVVCGVQGSGKSHSTSVLLESCLIQDERLGTLPAPLSGLVFHFGSAAGGGLAQPCEAAYLSALDPELGGSAMPPRVTVLAMPSSVPALSQVYSVLPQVEIKPLRFAAEDITADRLLAMMKVEEGGKMPLYMEYIMNVLRGMEGNFNYDGFRKQLKAQEFSPGQKAMLNLRLALLNSCLEGGNSSNRVPNYFRQGHLTIVDLSSPFMDSSSACGLFDIILGLFVGTKTDSAGKIVVLDEAHKYLTEDGSSQRLTESLLTVIREQRHLATRVVISTQEPTVVPAKFLDLCSFVIAHRFSSPEWLRHLSKHVSAAVSSEDDLYDQISSLETGEALLFAPAGLGLRSALFADFALADGPAHSVKPSPVARFGRGHLLVSSRLRITRDGGQSVLAVQDVAAPVESGRLWQPEGLEGDAPWPTPPTGEEDFDRRLLTPMSLGWDHEDPTTSKEAVRAHSKDGTDSTLHVRAKSYSGKPGSSGAPLISPLSPLDDPLPPPTSTQHGLTRSSFESGVRTADLSATSSDSHPAESSDVLEDFHSASSGSMSSQTSEDGEHETAPNASPMKVFEPLIKIIEHHGQDGKARVPWLIVAHQLVHATSPPAISSGKKSFLEPYLQAAADADLIVFESISSSSGGWVELSPSAIDRIASSAAGSSRTPIPALNHDADTPATSSSTRDAPHSSSDPRDAMASSATPTRVATLAPTIPTAAVKETSTSTTASASARPDMASSVNPGSQFNGQELPSNNATDDSFQSVIAVLKTLHRAGIQKVSTPTLAKWLSKHPELSKPDVLARCMGDMKAAGLIEEDKVGIQWLPVSSAKPSMPGRSDLPFRPSTSTSSSHPANDLSAAMHSSPGPGASSPSTNIPPSYASAPTQQPTLSAVPAGEADGYLSALPGNMARRVPPNVVPASASAVLEGDFLHVVTILKELHRSGTAKVPSSVIVRRCVSHPDLCDASALARCLKSMKTARVINEDQIGVWLTTTSEWAPDLSASGLSTADPRSAESPESYASPSLSATQGSTSAPADHMRGTSNLISGKHRIVVESVKHLVSTLRTLHRAGISKVAIGSLAPWCAKHPELSKSDHLLRCVRGMEVAKIVGVDGAGIWMIASQETIDSLDLDESLAAILVIAASKDVAPSTFIPMGSANSLPTNIHTGPILSDPVCVPARFAPLVQYLHRKRQEGDQRVRLTDIGAPMRRLVPELTGKNALGPYMTAASQAGLINFEPAMNNKPGWVELRVV